MKSLNMKAFIGIGFDLEVKHSVRGVVSFDKWSVAKDEKRTLRYLGGVRPRLNKPQVLDDYSKVLIDGLVYRFGFMCGDKIGIGQTVAHSFGYIPSAKVVWLECIGLEDKPEWREESERLSMPLIKVEEKL